MTSEGMVRPTTMRRDQGDRLISTILTRKQSKCLIQPSLCHEFRTQTNDDGAARPQATRLRIAERFWIRLGTSKEARLARKRPARKARAEEVGGVASVPPSDM